MRAALGPHRGLPAFLVVVTAIGAGPSAPVRAADPVSDVDPEARALYIEGQRLYRTGAYDDAIARFRASYAREPAAGLLYDLAQAHRLKGDCAGARDLYRRYLAEAPASQVAALARGHLTEVEACAAQPPAIAAPAVAPAIAAPARLAAFAVATPPLAARPSRFARTSVRALGAVTLALGAAGGFFAWRADRSADQVSAAFKPGQMWDGSRMDAERSGQISEVVALGTLGAALVTGGLAVWLAARD